MPDVKGLWDLLDWLQRRAAVIASAIALALGIVNSLLDKANPPVLPLSIFTVLVVGLCLWITLAREKVIADEGGAPQMRRPYSRNQSWAAWAGAAFVLAGAWSFVYREHIRYSTAADYLLGRPRIIVSDAVAWQVIKYSTPTGDRSNTIVGELASLVADLPYRIVVMKRTALSRYEPTERDVFLLEGVAVNPGMDLNATMFITKPRAERLAGQLTKDISLSANDEDNGLLTLPAKRFLSNQFLFSHFTINVPLSEELLGKQEVEVARLTLRYALATVLFYDGHPDAASIFREILRIGPFIPKKGPNPALASMYKTTGYYLAAYGHNIDDGLAALELASLFAPADRETKVMQAYLHLSAGRFKRAGELLEELKSDQDDQALIDALRGEYLSAQNRFVEAAAAYRAALQTESDNYYRAFLDLGIALAYGLSAGPREEVSGEMIKALEDAIQLQPDISILYIVQGYAWSLVGNAEMSREAFDSGRKLAKSASENRMVAYWLGRSLLELGDYAKAVEELEKAVGDLKQSKEADLLAILGESLLNSEGREADAEAYLDRALELDPENARARRLKGLAMARRLELSTSQEQKRSLNREARGNLLKSIRLGEEGAAIHLLLAALYEDAGDTVNAEKHRQRGCELEPGNAECLLREATKLIEARSVSLAKETLAQAHRMKPDDADLWGQEGIIWYKRGYIPEAKSAYEEALRRDPNSAPYNDNLAYVLFDLGQYPQALERWEQALKVNPGDADPLAGKAIALSALGMQDEALTAYRAAAAADKSFLDCNVLKEKYMWSDRACQAAKPLIAALSKRDPPSLTTSK